MCRFSQVIHVTAAIGLACLLSGCASATQSDANGSPLLDEQSQRAARDVQFPQPKDVDWRSDSFIAGYTVRVVTIPREVFDIGDICVVDDPTSGRVAISGRDGWTIWDGDSFSQVRRWPQEMRTPSDAKSRQRVDFVGPMTFQSKSIGLSVDQRHALIAVKTSFIFDLAERRYNWLELDEPRKEGLTTVVLYNIRNEVIGIVRSSDKDPDVRAIGLDGKQLWVLEDARSDWRIGLYPVHGVVYLHVGDQRRVFDTRGQLLHNFEEDIGYNGIAYWTPSGFGHYMRLPNRQDSDFVATYKIEAGSLIFENLIPKAAWGSLVDPRGSRWRTITYALDVAPPQGIIHPAPIQGVSPRDESYGDIFYWPHFISLIGPDQVKRTLPFEFTATRSRIFGSGRFSQLETPEVLYLGFGNRLIEVRRNVDSK